MTILHDHVEPGERVPWQSTTYREALRELLKDMGIIAAMLAFEMFIAGEVFFSMLFGGFVGYFAVTTAWRRPSEMFLTDRRFLVRSGIFRPHVAAFARKDLTGLEIYNGDGTVVLHAQDGEVIRTAIIGDAAELMAFANLPVTLWRNRNSSVALNLTVLGIIVVPVCAILTMFAIGLGMVIALPQPPLKSAFLEFIRSVAPFENTVRYLVVYGGSVIGVLLGLILMAVIRRNFLTPEDLRALRCARHDPRWLGKDPRSPFYRVPLVRLVRALRAGFGRVVYGPYPECGDIEPERFGPGEPPDEKGDA